jgi:hypothetical protein
VYNNVVTVTLTTAHCFSYSLLGEGNFMMVVCVCSAYKVVHDCRKFEKHWSETIRGPDFHFLDFVRVGIIALCCLCH